MISSKGLVWLGLVASGSFGVALAKGRTEGWQSWSPRPEIAPQFYPVFKTDFGMLGLMICWDLQFPEPARALALKGAEIIQLPIWGGNELLARARAIENHVFLITSSYDMRTFIVDPTGAVLAEANAKEPVAHAELCLDRRIIQPWLGDMKTRTWLERRGDIPVK